MRRAWPVQDVQAAEAALMATLPESALMQRAAAGLARRCADLLGGSYGARVALLVGGGNNGGDALYAGARLARRGARIAGVLLSPERAHRGGLAALRAAYGQIIEASDAEAVEVVAAADLVIDGVVGIGGRGGLRPRAAELAEIARSTSGVRVAVDVPSGVDADSGDVSGAAFRADVTVTFGCLKPGLLVSPGAEHAGVVDLVDIGLLPWLPDSRLQVPEAADVAELLPVPGPGDDKYTRGVAGIASGSAAYGGAAVLSVGGAARGGAGMVRYAGHAHEQVRAAWPEVIVTEGDPNDAGRVQSWVVGPGLGTDEQAAGVVRQVLDSDVPVLVDADGLTVLAAHPEWVRERPQPTVLTPHDREYERLAGAVGGDRVAAACRAAAQLRATVLLKGNTTVVASPDGRVTVNPTGTPWLGTAGSGDVLSGLVGALLAGGLDAHDAATAGAFLHGLAASRAADGAPIRASDVIRALPDAYRTVRG